MIDKAMAGYPMLSDSLPDTAVLVLSVFSASQAPLQTENIQLYRYDFHPSFLSHFPLLLLDFPDHSLQCEREHL